MSRRNANRDFNQQYFDSRKFGFLTKLEWKLFDEIETALVLFISCSVLTDYIFEKILHTAWALIYLENDYYCFLCRFRNF